MNARGDRNGRGDRAEHRKLPALPGRRTIRGRVAVVLAVPTCLLLVLTGVGVADRADAYGDAQETADRVGLVLGVQHLVRELQRERGLTNGLLAGDGGYRDELTAQRLRSDQEQRALRGRLTGHGADTAPAVTRALARLGGLTDVRERADERALPRTEALRFYTGAVDALNSAQAAEGDRAAYGDPRLAAHMDALQALADATESVALERAQLNGVYAYARYRGGEYLDFTEVRARRLAAVRQYEQFAVPQQRKALDRAFATRDAVRAAGYEKRAEAAADGSRPDVRPGPWWRAMTTLVDDLHEVRVGVAADARDRAGQLAADATRQLTGLLALGALVLGLAVALAWFAARAITRPLGALAQEADEVAGRRLPDAVAAIQEGHAGSGQVSERPAPADQLGTSAGAGAGAATGGPEEVDRLAAALRNVERTAVHLAHEQAVLRHNNARSLANLGRRNQNLLHRQLGLITALETHETNPDALADLFELDHLATRMRRNAESLLVLAGEVAPQRTWSGTVTITEVIQSAVAEVEDYRRVSVVNAEPCRVRGHAVADLSHLLAELLENALAFSPPSRPVEMHGWRDGGEYCLAIVDRGIGMTPDDLARANGRLAGGETLLLEPARLLGHYVVAKLAARLGAHVELSATAPDAVTAPSAVPGGTTAHIALPPSLLGRLLPADQPPGPDQVRSLLDGFRTGVARGAAATPHD